MASSWPVSIRMVVRWFKVSNAEREEEGPPPSAAKPGKVRHKHRETRLAWYRWAEGCCIYVCMQGLVLAGAASQARMSRRPASHNVRYNHPSSFEHKSISLALQYTEWKPRLTLSCVS
jgi:hypothetical protein